MFIQVIEGKTHDPEALHRQIDVWERDLKRGAIGYRGSTAGCTSTGDCILVARFESEEEAIEPRTLHAVVFQVRATVRRQLDL